jgi:hypothetical protein
LDLATWRSRRPRWRRLRTRPRRGHSLTKAAGSRTPASTTTVTRETAKDRRLNENQRGGQGRLEDSFALALFHPVGPTACSKLSKSGSEKTGDEDEEECAPAEEDGVSGAAVWSADETAGDGAVLGISVAVLVATDTRTLPFGIGLRLSMVLKSAFCRFSPFSGHRCRVWSQACPGDESERRQSRRGSRARSSR